MSCTIGGAASQHQLSPGTCYYFNKKDFMVIKKFDAATSTKIINTIRTANATNRVLFNASGSIKIINEGTAPVVLQNKITKDTGVFLDENNYLKSPLTKVTYFLSDSGYWLLRIDPTKTEVSLLYNPIHRQDVNKMYETDRANVLAKFDEYCKQIEYGDPTCFCMPVDNRYDACITDMFNGNRDLMNKVKTTYNEGYTKLASNCPCMNFKCATSFEHLPNPRTSFMSALMANPASYDSCKNTQFSFTLCNTEVSAGGSIGGAGASIAQNCQSSIENTHTQTPGGTGPTGTAPPPPPGPTGTAPPPPPGPTGTAPPPPPGPTGTAPPGPTGTAPPPPPGPTGTAPPGPTGTAPHGPTGTAPTGPTGTGPTGTADGSNYLFYGIGGSVALCLILCCVIILIVVFARKKKPAR